MKKILSLLLVFVMLFCIVGCGKQEPNDNSTTTTTESDNDNNINLDVDVDVDVNVDTSDETNTKPAPKPTETTTKKNVPETTTEKKNENKPVTIQKKDFGNGQIVFYPSNIKESNTTYPIIAFANGTGFSYDIYENLIIALAKGGYVVIANTETMAADGTAQLNSVDFLISQNKNSSSVFYNKLNTDKIGLAGHSQGGRSAVNAGAKDSRVDCVISFAGSNYIEEAEKLSVPALFFSGSADMIVNAKQWLVPAFENCKGPAVYACLKNAGHTRCCTNPEDYSEYAIAWLNIWLKNDTNAKVIFRDGGKLSKDGAWQDFACKGI